ncbi:Type II secretion system F domain [Desulfurobacterium thermolithotrophum DSM 11699]|uniref:Type II secretion system F domain n=1 Tax=Desulfurobacterium thermolithotrophum (strain DSM 11699 / BSA) TaxID=868864 RepID=F0S1U6_DESTD|nr:type II secretion system F family protein [Desulfurobacterium thermolithotrophum]ADY72951.1 Type II secretion system F domain [Desulfurobacterium thermolithotrophum DSM 11699]
MAIYTYVGRDILDRKRKGKIEADNEKLAKQLLFSKGIVHIEKLKEDKSIFKSELDFSFLNRISTKDKLIFTRQLYAMIHAGISIVTALRIIKEQIQNKSLKKIIEDIASHIEEGGKFSTALSKYKNIFGELYISMIRAAEESGTLEETLKRLAEYLEKIEKLRGKIKSALFYPAFVLLIATIIIGGILIFIIPTFKALYKDLGGELPSLTQFVIELSNFLRDYVGWIVLGLVLTVVLLVSLRKFKKARYLMDLTLLRLPIIGQLILKASIASFSRTLSSMVSSGLNILNALSISGETTNNEVLRRAINGVRNQVEKGISISVALSRYKVFSPMLINMVAIGEEAGNLDEMLSKVADFYEEEVDRTVDALTSLIEPIMMVFIGGIIGFIIIAMYLPIFKIGELIK